jgi:lipopolysaccharide export system protein LptA
MRAEAVRSEGFPGPIVPNLPVLRVLSASLFALLISVPAGAETWRFSASQVTSIQKDKSSRTVLDGDARVESEKFTITASQLELAGSDYDRISGSGGVSLIDKERELTVTSGRFVYDRTAKIIRFRELVTLVDEKEGIVIRCESLDLQEEDEVLVLQVAVRLIKEETVCRGEYATFRMDDNILEISGRPVVWRKDDEYRADRIQVNLDSDEIILEGGVAGALTTKGDEDE